ncbi:MAG: ABC transporter ATP-binding protein [Hahellaceae bacterium]|nr:ABC transporter ATP-binding protein [Hahellaceae bacterium]MCP5170574.1 ABC transporter ATP-binding protein [Hahellaceae bacterium]
MIVLQNISRIFQVGDQQVYGLNDINLTINKGEYVSVMGASGSGKSTLLNILGLLDTPSLGHYHLLNHDTTRVSEPERDRLRREHIGFVFQSYHLVPRLTARENIELPLVLAGAPRAQRKAACDALLERLSLTDRAGHLPNQLSGGQRQRVAIARALITQPQLLLADEPTGNLDSHSGSEVITLLEALHQEGITLLVVTHDKSLGDRAERHLEMLDGRIVVDTRRSRRAASLA